MLQRIVYRLASSIPVVFGVVAVGFALLYLVPVDPAAVRAGEGATPEILSAIRSELGLDRPLYDQFISYLGDLLSGDLGNSLLNHAPVSHMLFQAMGPTIELMFGSLGFAIIVGMSMGVAAALSNGGWVDRVATGASVLGISTPVFVTCLLLMQFAVQFQGAIPVQGRAGPIWELEGLKSIVLPSLSLSTILIGPILRLTRSTLIDTLSQDHVRTARAKGIGEVRVVLLHGLRNALVPIVTLIGLMAGYLLGGAVITETVFAWPGVGRLAIGAIAAGDFPMAQGAIMILAFWFIIINLAVDLLCAAIDPKSGRA